MHENLWVAIKWKFFSGKDNYILPFQMPYSFLCCCKYPLRYVFLFEQRKFHQFWTGGKWVKLLTSLWTATIYPQNKSGRVRFLCWPTYIIWKGHVSLMWKFVPKDRDGKSYHVNWPLMNLLFSLQWLINCCQ